MKLFRNKNFVSRSLILVGSIILLFSLSVDILKGGGQPASFGFKQVIGMVFGFLLICSGTTIFLRNSDSGIAELIQSHKTSFAVYLAIALGLSWLLYIYNAGIGFSPDSVAYQSFALKMHNAADFDIGATWPPLYPIIIHIVMYIHKFPAGAAAIISGLSMIGVLIIFALILCKYSHDAALIMVFIASLFFWDKFLSIYTRVWSEGPFAFILVLALFLVITHFEKLRTRDYIYASLIIALAPFIRYIGLALVGLFLGYTIYFIFAFRVYKYSSVAKYLLLSTISFLPIGLYFSKNYRDTGTLFGERLPSTVTIFGSINSVLEVLLKDINIYFRIPFLISVIFYVIILFHKNRTGNAKNLFPLSFILIFFFLYTCFILYTTTQAKVDPIGTRYYAPLYPYLLIFTFIGLETILSSELPGLIGFSNIRLLRIGIISLISISLLTNLIGFNTSLDNISKIRFVPASHPEAGFNLSPTSSNFNKYFRKILNRQDQIHVVVMMDDQQTYNKYFGPDMFYRENILKSSSTNHFAFGNLEVSDNYWGTVKDFSISMQIDGAPKTIYYHNTPRIKNDRQLANSLLEITEKYSTDNITLIVHSKNLQLVGEDTLLPTIDERFDLVSSETIDPYKVYELTRSQ